MKLRKHRHAGHWVCGVAVSMAMLLTSVSVGSERHPIRVWGELGYDFRHENFDNGGDTLEHALIADLNASTYIYEPWIATIEGGVGAVIRTVERDDGDNDNDSYTGYGRLRLMPLSRFPFEAYAERTDSRNDSDLAGLDLERTRFGFLQRYTRLDGSSYRLRYEHTDQHSNTRTTGGAVERRNDVADLLQASFNRSFGSHNIYFDSQYNHIERDNSTDRKTKSLFSSLRHTYSPGPTLSAEDLLTYNVTEVERALADVKTGILQLNSFAYWRPRTERPLRVNATFRAQDRTSESGGVEGSARSATGTIGATYQWTPRLLFSGSTGATGIESDDDSEVLTFQTLSAGYTSEQFRLANFDAGWFAQGDLRNNTDDSGSLQSVGVQGGYNLRRSFSSSNAISTQLNVSQSLGLVSESDGIDSQRLLSQLSLSWHSREQATSRLMRASITDSRTWASGDRANEVEGEFQLANLQASLDHRLSATSSISGNVTVQATRNSMRNPAGGADPEDGEWIPTATADITYLDRMVFDVPRLTFRSTLRFISDSYLPLFDEPDDLDGREDMRWDNRLEYNIGRLQLRAIGRLSEIQDEKQTFFLFQVRRLFGDI